MPKPFCFIPHYQYEGDSAFGIWSTEFQGYVLGDGDIYGEEHIKKYFNGKFYTYNELEKILRDNCGNN